MITPHQVSFYKKEINSNEVIKYFKLNKMDSREEDFYQFCLYFNIYIVYKYNKHTFIYEPYKHTMIAFNVSNSTNTYLEQNNQYLNTHLYTDELLSDLDITYIKLDNSYNLPSLKITVPKISNQDITDVYSSNLLNSLAIRRSFISILQENKYNYSSNNNNLFITTMPNKYSFIKNNEEFTTHDFNQYFKYTLDNQSDYNKIDKSSIIKPNNILDLYSDEDIAKLNDYEIHNLLYKHYSMDQLYLYFIYKLITKYIDIKQFKGSDGLDKIIRYYNKFQRTMRKHNIKDDIFLNIHKISKRNYKLCILNSLHHKRPYKFYYEFSGFNDKDNRKIDKIINNDKLMQQYKDNSIVIDEKRYISLDIINQK